MDLILVAVFGLTWEIYIIWWIKILSQQAIRNIPVSFLLFLWVGEQPQLTASTKYAPRTVYPSLSDLVCELGRGQGSSDWLGGWRHTHFPVWSFVARLTVCLNRIWFNSGATVLSFVIVWDWINWFNVKPVINQLNVRLPLQPNQLRGGKTPWLYIKV